MGNIWKKETFFLIFVFLLAFILRIFYCSFFKENILYIQANIFGDTQQYISVAKNILEGKGIILSPDIRAKITPIYPLFLSGTYFLFGEGYWGIRIIQIFISSLSCIFVYLLGKELIDKYAGRIASLITAIYPFFIFFTGFILTETLFIFLLLLTIYFLQTAQKNAQISNIIAAGILLGITILCRPSLIAFFFVFSISLFIPHLWIDWNNRFKIGSIILFCAVLTMIPWTVRNFIHFQKFIPLTTMSGQVLWEGNNPHATGGPCGYWPEEIKELSEIERDRYLRNAAIEFIKDNPKQFVKLTALKFIRFWNIVPNYGGFSSVLYKLISLFFYVPVLITALYGMFLTRKSWKEFLLIYVLLFSSTLGHMLFVSSIRYRVPLMPFIIIFSSCGFIRLYRKIKGNSN